MKLLMLVDQNNDLDDHIQGLGLMSRNSWGLVDDITNTPSSVGDEVSPL